MSSKWVRINGTQFIGWFAFLFAVSLAVLVAVFRAEPLLEYGRTYVLITISMSAVMAAGGAFVICGVRQVICALRSGDLVFADLVSPILKMLLVTVIFALAYTLLPFTTKVFEASLLVALAVSFLLDGLVRIIGKRKDRRTMRGFHAHARDETLC